MTSISPSEIQALLKRVRERRYTAYLVRMKLKKLRGFEGAEIRFDFPVTALVGPNGSGKTTVLGAAGLIYEEVEPRRFFARGGVYDASMSGWKVEYDLLSAGQQLPRTASYSERTVDARRSKWNRKHVARPVKVIGVSRTLPLTERTDNYKFAKGDFQGVSETKFADEVVKAVEAVLGKSAADYLQVDADRSGKYSILARRMAEPEGLGYSEFHFGAGEASIIRIISDVESVQENALILIEEIENGLHPVATRRLVEYLLGAARRKGCQVIFTTHSNAALIPLPHEAVWSAHKGSLTQGKLDIESLRALTGEIDARLALFTEDKFASLVAEVSLRRYGEVSGTHVDLSAIEIHALAGASQARDQAKFQNLNPSRRFPAVALLDGDKRLEAGYRFDDPKLVDSDGQPFVSYIPGNDDPEATIFDSIHGEVLASLNSPINRLTVALGFDSARQHWVRDCLMEVSAANTDRHTVFRELGDRLDFLAEDVVARAFVSTWCNENEAEVVEMWERVRHCLPSVRDEAEPAVRSARRLV